MMGTLLGVSAVVLVAMVIVGDGVYRRRCIVAWRRTSSRATEHARARAIAGSAREPSGPVLALLIVDVAARLRAGAPLDGAWRAAWDEAELRPPWCGIDDRGVPRVVAALAHEHSLAEVRGLGDLRQYWRGRGVRARAARRAAQTLKAACSLTVMLGSPVAQVLDLVADGVDEAESAEESRQAATSGVQTSARIMTALPLVALGGAWGLGADPIARFTDGGVGTLSALVGVSCMIAAHLVSRTLIRRAQSSVGGVDSAVLCDLACAGLESGASIPRIIEALGMAEGSERLERIGREIALGVAWDRAWEESPEEARALARALKSAWCDGVAPGPMLHRASAQIRSRRAADARIEAEKLGVHLVAPLGALLLPAFIALGILPIIMHLMATGSGFT